VAPGNAEETVRILNARSSVDFLFADVNMPGDMDGLGLARWTQENHPLVKVGARYPD
jgi:DNA-binding LytR/AlgR family response regulator